jgi:S1-C subfamily serine protease
MLLTVPRLRVSPAVFSPAAPSRGDKLVLYSVPGTPGFQQQAAGNDVNFTVQSTLSTVSAVHDNGELEYTAGSADTLNGAILLDAETHEVVGFTNGETPGAQGSYLAAEPSLIAGLTDRTLTYAAGSPSAPAPSSDLAALSARIRPDVVQIIAAESGSGVVIRQAGSATYILTAAHVIKSAPTINVFTAASSAAGVPATVVACRDARGARSCADGTKQPDLALLRIPSFSAPPVAYSAGIDRGNAIFVLGFPGAEYTRAFNDVTMLKIAAPKLDQGVVDVVDRAAGTFDHDVVTDNGNSGGPIFDLDGNLAGVVEGTTAVGSGTYVGIDVATIRRFVDRYAP